MPSPAPVTVRAVRVLVVDDSPFMRRALERLLHSVPGVSVVGAAADGFEAVRRTLELRPDVITMDVEMPKMDGLRAVQEIMRVLPTPIVMVSSLTPEGANMAIRALEAGAVECLGKPSGLSVDLPNIAEQLGRALLRASEARPFRKASAAAVSGDEQNAANGTDARHSIAEQVFVIGSSTGGPHALTEVIPRFPESLAAAVIVVQHMPAGFTQALARRLDSLSTLPVAEAIEAEPLLRGRVYVAPGNFHLGLTAHRHIALSSEPAVHGVRPSVDVTLDSVRAVYGANVSAAILTGMGRDGADGAARLDAAGGCVFAQDEASCVIYGMPKACMEQVPRAVQLPLDQIAAAMVAALAIGGTVR